MAIKNDRFLRIGVFYDGTYFAHVSNFYLHNHQRASRLSIEGLHQFIRTEVSRQEQLDERFCQIVDAHYFRGRLSARQVRDSENEADASLLYRERQFDDVLIREGVTLHYLPMPGATPDAVEEKGIDVWFALEAFEMSLLKKYDIVVLVTGDGDFVPLVRKLNTHGTRVMLLGWDLSANGRSTRTSQALINEVTYPVMMHDEIESRGRIKDRVIDTLFVKPRDTAPYGHQHRNMELFPPAAVNMIPPSSSPASITGPAAQAPANEDWRKGTVCHYVEDRGFGFIRDDEGDEQFFFHIRSVVNAATHDLVVGRPVRFRAGSQMHQGKERLQALAVDLLVEQAA